MADHIEFLKDRLIVVKKRIAATDDFKEAKVLEKLITELESVEEKPESVIQKHKIKSFKSTFERDNDNSPVSKEPHGNRLRHVYNLIEEITKAKGGVIDIWELARTLKDEYNIFWKDKLGYERSGGITSYILCYNRLNIDDQRLELFPKCPPGMKRCPKYFKVKYTGKEHLSNKTN